MRFLVALSLFGFALGMPAVPDTESLIATNYHEVIGIPEASRIKAAEEAINFDGTRIVGGNEATLGQYSHFGGLLITLNSGSTSVCGSSLVSNTKAVTAAHCWFDGSNQARQFEVVLGSLALFSGGTRVVSSNVVMHENWNPNTIANDVAIITLSWVTYSSTVSAIALPTGTLLNQDFTGHWANACGFGRQSDTAGISTAQRLHHTSLQVISNTECSRWFSGSILTSTLCIDGSSRRSTCGGDSGGPLAINNNGQDVLIGITSFGYRWGCSVGWPAAFARVTSFASWFNARL